MGFINAKSYPYTNASIQKGCSRVTACTNISNQGHTIRKSEEIVGAKKIEKNKEETETVIKF